MRKLSKEEDEALVLLAQRITNKLKIFHWYDFNSHLLSARCNICNENIKIFMRSDHGIKHLKEHNLLCFI